jgi:hypothetical protein
VGVYLVEAVVVASDEAQAVWNVANLAKVLLWRWNDYEEPVGIYVHPGRLTCTWFGRVAVSGKRFEEGVVTYRVGRTWEGMDG